MDNNTVKVFQVVIDDGDSFLTAKIVAKSERELHDIVHGNGDITAIRDISNKYPIDMNYVTEILFDEFEPMVAKIIVASIREYYSNLHEGYTVKEEI